MQESDVILVGAGIMSATLGVLLKELNPQFSISIYERLDQAALESTNAWNNAGTGHSAFCELNYTPLKNDGSISISKAIKIAEQFEITRQFWSYLIENNCITNPRDFIHTIPHLSFVWGNDNVDFLKRRFELLKQNPLFSDMIYSEDANKINEWLPLVMEQRKNNDKVAATYMKAGTDVDFGVLTKKLLSYLEKKDGVTIYYNHHVKKLKQKNDQKWHVKIKNLLTDETFKCKSKFVFLGAGGGSLLLLNKANVDEGEGYGGFPVSGQWLRCTNKDIIKKHDVKVYGKASVGAPPMSVPHLDTRIIDGKKELLFGPYAGFSTKFLKNGSYLDLVNSLESENIKPMLYAGWNNIPLTKYLIEQVLQSNEDRLEALKEYYPNAKMEDWELLEAGQRVQVIKKDEIEGGILEFGTEIITTNDGSLACLLGASPGASTAVSAMLEIVNKCFQNGISNKESNLKQMIPSYGLSLNENPELCKKIRINTAKILKLKE